MRVVVVDRCSMSISKRVFAEGIRRRWPPAPPSPCPARFTGSSSTFSSGGTFLAAQQPAGSSHPDRCQEQRVRATPVAARVLQRIRAICSRSRILLAPNGLATKRSFVGPRLGTTAAHESQKLRVAGALGIPSASSRTRGSVRCRGSAGRRRSGLGPHVAVSVGYQHIRNPADNRDRGMVSVYGLRLHADG
jgi:hypothetical protein